MTQSLSEHHLQAIMELIINSGTSKSEAMEAIYLAKENNFTSAAEKLKQSELSLVEAHHGQTQLLTDEANGNVMPITLLAIHSQDHLMNSITFNDLAKEIIELYKKVNELEQRI